MGGLFLVLEAVSQPSGWSENVWIAFLPAIAAAIPGIITAIAQIKDKKYNKLTKLVENNSEETKKSLREYKTLIEDIKKKLEEQDHVDELHKEALKTLLRENIDEMYQLYYKQYKHMPSEAKDELQETFDIYSKLGGNHIGERKYNKMMELPDKEEDIKKPSSNE